MNIHGYQWLSMNIKPYWWKCLYIYICIDISECLRLSMNIYEHLSISKSINEYREHQWIDFLYHSFSKCIWTSLSSSHGAFVEFGLGMLSYYNSCIVVCMYCYLLFFSPKAVIEFGLWVFFKESFYVIQFQIYELPDFQAPGRLSKLGWGCFLLDFLYIFFQLIWITWFPGPGAIIMFGLGACF